MYSEYWPLSSALGFQLSPFPFPLLLFLSFHSPTTTSVSDWKWLRHPSANWHQRRKWRQRKSIPLLVWWATFFTVMSRFFIIAGVHSQESVNLKDKNAGRKWGIGILSPIFISCGLKTKLVMKEQNMVPCVSTANPTEVTCDKANCLLPFPKHRHVSPSYLHILSSWKVPEPSPSLIPLKSEAGCPQGVVKREKMQKCTVCLMSPGKQMTKILTWWGWGSPHLSSLH